MKDDRPVLAASILVAALMLLVVLGVLAFAVVLDPVP